MTFVLLRYNDRVCDDVIHEGSGHRSGEAEIINLNRRRPLGKNLRTFAVCVAVQIDQDVDVQLLNELGNMFVGHLLRVDEPVEGARYTRAELASLVATD